MVTVEATFTKEDLLHGLSPKTPFLMRSYDEYRTAVFIGGSLDRISHPQ
jgi:hypothetical protein